MLLKKESIAIPNALFPLMPKQGISIGKYTALLYLTILFLSAKNIELETYEIYLDDLLAIVGVKKNSRHVTQIQEELAKLRSYSIQAIEIPGDSSEEDKLNLLELGKSLVSLDGASVEFENYDQVTIGLVDRPGIRVRRGVPSKIIWRLDPAIKEMLRYLEKGNFSLLTLGILGLLSYPALSLACECFKYRHHYKGRDYGSTPLMPMEYWYRLLSGEWDTSLRKFNSFNAHHIKTALPQIASCCPFDVEMVVEKHRKIVVGAYFKIFNKDISRQEFEALKHTRKPNEPRVDPKDIGLTSQEIEEIKNELVKFNIEEGRALSIISKFPDKDYLIQHLIEHRRQIDRGGKPIISHEAVIRSRLENDYGSIRMAINNNKKEAEFELKERQKKERILGLFKESSSGTQEAYFNEFMSTATKVVVEQYQLYGKSSAVVMGNFNSFIIKKFS